MFLNSRLNNSFYENYNASNPKILNESILCHLFLPHNLPSTSDTDYLIQSDHKHEYKILERINEFLESLDTNKQPPIFQVLKKCIQYWAIIQNKENCTVQNLQSAIQKLIPGDFLPLYFDAQNAAILMEIDENHIDQPLISSWQVLLPTETITSSLEPHLSCFPVPVFRLSDRSQLLSHVHCELLVDLMNNTIEHTKVQKSSYRFDEVREVPIAHYVSQWWITQFQSAQIDNETNSHVKFMKKHRDHIRYTRSMLPFRRSGLWMTIKVVLHTILMKRLGNIGKIVYKLFITQFLTYCISPRNSSVNNRIPIDVLTHCVRKIARRLNKIEQLLLSIDLNDLNEWIQIVTEEIKSKVNQITTDSCWQEPIENQEKKIYSEFRLDPCQQETYQHPCLQLKAYLSDSRSDKFSRHFSDTFHHKRWESNKVADDGDGLPRLLLIYGDDDNRGVALTSIEIWIKCKLEQWISHSLQSDKEYTFFGNLRSFYEDYQRVALPWYYSENKSTDPIGYSQFILASLTIIHLMHKTLCDDERFQRLKLHAIRIPNLLELFEFLVLPNRDDMIRARTLYDYFQECYMNLYPDLLSDIESERSFGVHFADQSPKMNATLQIVQDEVEQDRNDKMEEVIKAKEKYEELMKKANNLVCKCENKKKLSYNKKCKRCNLVKKANNIKVSIYECPIPSDRKSALAVIFELQMPNEIRCYRDILWQFYNRSNRQASHEMYKWLSSRPHSNKLGRFYEGSCDFKVQLLSATRSLSETHYSAPLSVVSTPPESFFYDNSLKVQITPTRSMTLQDECRILTPELSDFKYKPLQFSIDSTQFTQNKTIAELSKCALQLKRTEFVEFGSFRSGHRLQWWNLLSMLELDSLSMDEESVATLITHALLQNGPMTTNTTILVCSWCPEAHQQLLEDHFVDELIMRLQRYLKDYECNWQNELILIIITVIVIRMFTICNLTRKKQMVDLVLKCRYTGEKWMQLISQSIQSSSSSDSNNMDALRDKIGIIGISSLLTFSVYMDVSYSLELSGDNVMSLLKIVTTVHDSLLLNKKQLNMTVFMRNLIRFSERVLVMLHPMVNKVLQKNSYEILNEFSSMYWAVTRTKGKMDGKWTKRSKNIYDGWYDGHYESNEVSIDCVTGKFVVNGMSVGFLPNRIISEELFCRVFGNHVFEVQQAEEEDSYITKHGYHNDEKIHYEFSYKSYRLRVYERHVQTNERFELIPPDCFKNELSEIFISNHSHWWNEQKKIVEFRPACFQHENFLHDTNYILELEKGYLRENKGQKEQYLVYRLSSFFKTLFERYFIRLDDEPFVYMLADNDFVNIHLFRLGIAFKFDIQNGVITSREYSDMYIDENQCFGTLTGLRSGLLLSPLAGIERKNRHQLCRKLIMPFGKVQMIKKADRHHQTVVVERVSASTSQFLHQYFVFF